MRYCSVEVLKKAHFHACLEATKSKFERLRMAKATQSDGATLVDAALAINALGTQTESDEQTGLANLLKGLGASTATRRRTTRG